MKRTLKYVTAMVLGISIATLAVHAANVHYKKAPKLTDNGTTATVCGTLTGLGNGDLTITILADGTRTTSCINPAGNFAPGNPGGVSVSGETTIPSSEIKNGNVSFCVTTEDPECESAKSCGCPNDNWAATITDVNFSSVVLVVEQGGQIVLQTTIK